MESQRLRAELTLSERLISRRAGLFLVRDALVSSFAVAFGLLLMWALVEKMRADELLAAGLSFVAANSLHYVFAHAWVYQGIRRAWRKGTATSC